MNDPAPMTPTELGDPGAPERLVEVEVLGVIAGAWSRHPDWRAGWDVERPPAD